jgi:hypothetical protein
LEYRSWAFAQFLRHLRLVKSQSFEPLPGSCRWIRGYPLNNLFFCTAGAYISLITAPTIAVGPWWWIRRMFSKLIAVVNITVLIYRYYFEVRR